jgi:hypothetical protein
MTPECLASPGTKIFIRGAGLACRELDESTNNFAVFLVRDTDNGSELNGRVGGQSLFDLKGVDVFTT